MRLRDTTCGHHGPIEDVPPRQGTITQFYRRMRGPGSRDRAIHWPDTFEFDTPAQGDAYTFKVVLHFLWCVTGRDLPEHLVDRALDHRSTLLEQLLVRLRSASRNHPPYEVAAAESSIKRAVTAAFAQTRYSYRTSAGPNGDVRPIEARAIVRLDEPVLEAEQHAWKRRQKAKNDHDYALELAPKLRDRIRIWQDFLHEGKQDWVTPYAAALAQQPDTTAKVMKEMFEDRYEQIKEFSEEIVEQSKQYDDADVFELMTHNDTALRRLMEYLKVPEPPKLERPPFDRNVDPSENGERP